jgi:hypothetical protein
MTPDTELSKSLGIQTREQWQIVCFCSLLDGDHLQQENIMKLLPSISNSPFCKPQLPERRTLMRSMFLKLGIALALCFGAANLAHATQNGGTVTINSKTSLNANTVNGKITADSTGAERGGTVKIIGSSSFMNATLPSVSAKNNAGTGDGGTIDISQLTMLTVNGTLTVNAGTAADSDGNGGTINIHDNGTVIVNSTTFTASGYGDGDGGNITLGSVTPIDISTAIINAQAGTSGSGDGGKVTINGATGPVGLPLQVNSIIMVDGGSGLLSAAENDFGRIQINSTTCQQRTTGLAPWPKTYWNCQHPDGSTPADKTLYTGANKLHATMKTALATAKIQIYIMRDVDAFKDYHNVGPASNVGVFGYSYEASRVSAAFFDTLPSTGTPTASALYSGDIIHEMSHQLNYWSWGHQDNVNATWLTAYNNANTAFDAPGLPPPATNNCPTVVDIDRLATTQPGGAICSKFDGSSGNPFLKNSDGDNKFGDTTFLNTEERFARAFADAYSRAFASNVFVDQYVTDVLARLPLERTYMDTVLANGAP